MQYVKRRAVEAKVDAERIALMGESAGGHLAALVALAGEHAAFREGNKGDPFGHLAANEVDPLLEYAK